DYRPAVSPASGGHRPPLPFETRFSLNRHGEAFPRDPAVVDTLRDAGMLRREAPLGYRREELKWLQSVYGLSDVFGDEVPGILQDMMGQVSAEDGSQVA